MTARRRRSIAMRASGRCSKAPTTSRPRICWDARSCATRARPSRNCWCRSNRRAGALEAGSPLRAPLLEECAALRGFVQQLLGAGADAGRKVGSIAYPFLQWLGVVAGGWQWALAAQAAETPATRGDALDAGSGGVLCSAHPAAGPQLRRGRDRRQRHHQPRAALQIRPPETQTGWELLPTPSVLKA